MGGGQGRCPPVPRRGVPTRVMMCVMALDTEAATKPMARLTPRNLKAVLDDMGVQPGIHVAADMYLWYVGMCEEEGAQPVTKKAFGLSLANQGCTPTTKRVNGKPHRAWLIPRSRFRNVVAREPKVEFSAESRHPTLEHPEGT